MLKVFAATAAILAASLSHAADLTVQVSDVKSADGNIMIAVFNSAGDFLKKPVAGTQGAASAAGTTVVIKDLPAGDYALVVYHDANGNGKLDKNLMGIPTEDYGFSNNASGKFGPPSFEAARFTLAAAGSTAKISLK